ncbi:MAG: peptide-methionine (S)-S-oxide reductase MsrA [Candidatus Jordarchaeales archaeon]
MNKIDVKSEVAIFAGGNFQHMLEIFSEVPGVLEVISGYTGGWKHNPTYEEVATGETGHFEAVMIIYDPSRISYEVLLEIFWRSIDFMDAGGQFADRGTQYRTAIFYMNEDQRIRATSSKKKIEKALNASNMVATLILKASKFYKAERIHQLTARKKVQNETTPGSV